MTTPHSQIRKGRKYDDVVEGARCIFLRDGFEGASVDDIARAAGVSKATLYAYFPDKRVLFSEIAMLECHRQACEHMASADLSGPPAEVMRRAGQKLVSFLLSDFGQSIFRISVAESARFPELGRRFYESGPMLVRSGVGHYLRLAVERGDLAIDDIDLAADQFAELCKASLFPRVVLGIATEVSQAEIDRVINGAVDMFMARYGV